MTELKTLKANLECDVCHRQDRHAKGVASSPFGPVSWAYCEECLTNNANPESDFLYLYWYVGQRGEGLRDISTEFTFKDGKYISWTDWKAFMDTQPEPSDLYPSEENENAGSASN